MAPRMVNVLVLEPGTAPIRTVKIDGDDYNALNRLVQGNLGSCSIPAALRRQDFYAFCDDDARLRDPRPEPNPYAAHLGHAEIFGPVVIVKTDAEGETRSLRAADIAALEMYLAQAPSDDARRAAAQEARWLQAHPTGTAVWSPDRGWQDL